MVESIRMKQAVVLIHGIGEQVQMDTLRGFVDAVWTTDSSLRRPNRFPPVSMVSLVLFPYLADPW
jgi:hypothetical protein